MGPQIENSIIPTEASSRFSSAGGSALAAFSTK
jgi:hypothetical protein